VEVLIKTVFLLVLMSEIAKELRRVQEQLKGLEEGITHRVQQQLKGSEEGITQSIHTLQTVVDTLFRVEVSLKEREDAIDEIEFKRKKEAGFVNQLDEMNKEKIVLNVGGERFETTKLTLLKCSDSMFSAM